MTLCNTNSLLCVLQVCRSTSGSVQESGQYDQSVALLEERHQHSHHHHPCHPMTVADPAPSLHWSEREQLLQQQHPTETSSGSGGAGRLCSPDMCRSNSSQARHQRLHGPQKPYHGPSSAAEQYPPHVPVSGDGEEGYVQAQRALYAKKQVHNLSWLEELNVLRPPPNKTVHDRDSPPPPYWLVSPTAHSLDSLIPSVEVGGRRTSQRGTGGQDSPPGLAPRSHSLSYQRQASIQHSHLIGRPPAGPPLPRAQHPHQHVSHRQVSDAPRHQPPEYHSLAPAHPDRAVQPTRTTEHYDRLPNTPIHGWNCVSNHGQAQVPSARVACQDQVLENASRDSVEGATNKSNNRFQEHEAKPALAAPLLSSSCVSPCVGAEQAKTTSRSETFNCLPNNRDNQQWLHTRSSPPSASPSSSSSSSSSHSASPSASHVLSFPPSSSVPHPPSPQPAQHTGSPPRTAQHIDSPSPQSSAQHIYSTSPQPAQYIASASPPPTRHIDAAPPPPTRHIDSASPPPTRHIDSASPPPAQHIDSASLQSSSQLTGSASTQPERDTGSASSDNAPRVEHGRIVTPQLTQEGSSDNSGSGHHAEAKPSPLPSPSSSSDCPSSSAAPPSCISQPISHSASSSGPGKCFYC